MSPAALSRWAAGELVPIEDCEPHEYELAAADSFLVTQGTAIRPERHRERFREAVRGALPDGSAVGDELDAFWDAAMAAIPGEAEWFPRIELRMRRGAAELVLRVRPAPQRHTTVVLSTHSGADPRRAPSVKGPDLSRMLALRTRAHGLGADEAVIVDENRLIVDGTTSSIVWWDGDVLCVVPRSIPRIPSVTESVLRELAHGQDIEVAEVLSEPGELDGCEVWVVNALHGIRGVTSWLDGPETQAVPGRIQQWRDLHEGCRKPMIGPPA